MSMAHVAKFINNSVLKFLINTLIHRDLPHHHNPIPTHFMTITTSHHHPREPTTPYMTIIFNVSCQEKCV